MRGAALCLTVLCALAVVPVSAQTVTGDEAAFVEVADSVYAFVGRRNDANALVVVTTAGVVLVDTGNSPLETRVLQRFIQSVTAQPVRYVVISQNYGDHTGGTPLFAPPATVVVHDKVTSSWGAWRPHQISAWRKRFPERTEALEDAVPADNVVSFSDRMTLTLGGTAIELIYVEHEYNLGDIAVWLPASGVLHAGFAGYFGRHPDIRPDYSHGTSAGMLEQLSVLKALAPRVVVPAHGPLGDATALQALSDYLLLARSKVRTMLQDGVPLDAVVQRFHMEEFEGWDREEHFPGMAEGLYRELRGQGPQIVPFAEQRIEGTLLQVEGEGRRLVVKPETGGEVRLRVTSDTDIDGVADRSQLSEGMDVSALYVVPQGANARSDSMPGN